MSSFYRLLIIDDDEVTLESFKEFFQKKNFKVDVANDGLTGLKLLESETPAFDIVITDLVMPGISGVGVTAIVKKKFADMPVIAITGWGEHPEALASEAHADIVLRKPFELAKLEKIILEILDKKQSL